MQIGKIEYPTLQKSISSFYESKGIRLDVYTADESHVFDIEIQTSIPPDLGKRTRYYQSMMDCDNLLKGQNYNDLKESYVIFICLSDPFTNEINGLVEQAKLNEVFRSDYLTMNLREYDLRRMGREEGIKTNKLDNARNMLADNVAVERIARYTGLPLETVRKLKAELSTAQEKQ